MSWFDARKKAIEAEAIETESIAFIEDSRAHFVNVSASGEIVPDNYYELGDGKEEAMPHKPPEPEDIRLFKLAQQEAFAIFLCRRKEHGAFNQNAEKYPYEHLGMMLGKLGRTARSVLDKIRTGKPLQRDTLIDLSNYALMLMVEGDSQIEKGEAK